MTLYPTNPAASYAATTGMSRLFEEIKVTDAEDERPQVKEKHMY